MCAPPRLRKPEAPQPSFTAPSAPANQGATQVGRSRNVQTDSQDTDSGTLKDFDLRLAPSFQILRDRN